MTTITKTLLSVRELQAADIPLISDYWLNSDPEFLTGMGVDLNKLPTREQFTQMLESQLNLPLEQKRSYCLIWESDGKAIGHCNTNPTSFGEEAFMHLHLWKNELRQKGMGLNLLSHSLPHFFNKLKIKRLYSEPYALNLAPNNTLEKAGFTFLQEYVTVPGSLNFEQPVKRWVMTSEKFQELYGN